LKEGFADMFNSYRQKEKADKVGNGNGRPKARDGAKK
jgi:hypothetical protein